MDFKNDNGVATESTTQKSNAAETLNGTTKAGIPKPTATAKTEVPAKLVAEKPQTEKPAEAVKPQPTQMEEAKPIIKELSLNDRLKVVNDLHRKSIQRLNLITRIKQLEEFEVALAQDSDELADNPYQGCRLIIEDDNNREFVTTTPGLIRMVAQFIFEACNKKLSEIEATIYFPN